MRRLVLFALLCLTLAGCSSIASLAGLQNRLTDDGYTNVSVYHRSVNGYDILEVTAASSQQAADHEKIAETVWDTYPEHVDEVAILLNGTGKAYTAEELRSAFGERQVTVNPDDDGAIVVWLLVGLALFLLLIVGVIILIVVLVRRSRRRRLQQAQQAPLQYPPGVYSDGSTWQEGPPK